MSNKNDVFLRSEPGKKEAHSAVFRPPAMTMSATVQSRNEPTDSPGIKGPSGFSAAAPVIMPQSQTSESVAPSERNSLPTQPQELPSDTKKVSKPKEKDFLLEERSYYLCNGIQK